jgi:hypothetical protein
MNRFFSTPIDRIFADWWSRIDRAQLHGFAAAVCVAVLAFGFEMTNLTLHHDDVTHFFAGPLVGYYLGRFGHAWLNYYVQGGYLMPFLQMALGIVLMAAYGVLVARFWGARRTLEIAVVAAIVGVFPYMAQVYQYNTVMVPYPLAHLLAAAAVVLATRARPVPVAVGAVLFVAAFSIYQAVLANAATIFVIWVLSNVLFLRGGEPFPWQQTLRSTLGAIAAVVAGGLVYVAIVASLHIDFDAAQGADKAFDLSYRLEHGFPLKEAISAVLEGTRSSLLWPEAYFPDVLKKLQLVLVAGAALYCVWLPGRLWAKLTALLLLLVAILSPRTMQLLHPQGTYHNLTLTGYALVVAAAAMIVLRSGHLLARNVAAAVVAVLVVGYVGQCNWISTVNYLNTQAHYATMTQILAGLRSLADEGWDGRTIAVVGRLDMRRDHPFRPATGVATSFIDAGHMNQLARLMRDEATFVPADETMPKVLEYAAAHVPWPAPGSLGVVGGRGVVVLSRQ